ncbi:MAG: hypothetical protein HBSAPP02_05110 [Phycisphaerae bacterium]|nr:MAG: hypothetical protein HRU71_10905 [Planctomycetia bacterium]RIK71777.1 MAG: hypothetical protein DCC66_00645 [Planctomycetota bacterium]GJQ25479.1 MAG: hypothetical protein HBSAPP02_05110 [Phycisphaerae bacterium]
MIWQHRPSRRPFTHAWAIASLALVGCNIPPYRANFNSDDPTERIMAVQAAAKADDRAAVPLIVDRLEDEDSGVQFFAMLALERLTGERFGLESGQSSADRLAAIQRWRAYIDQGAHKMSMNQDTSRKAAPPADVGHGSGIAAPAEVRD